MSTIDQSQTTTAGQFPPLSGVLKLASLIYLTQDGTEYSLSVQALHDFMAANFLAPSDVIDSLTSTETTKPGSANQLKQLKQQIDTLQSTKLNVVDYNQHYRGLHTSPANLNTSIPTANSGDYAIVDSGVGQDAYMYIWDPTDLVWVQAGIVGGTLTTTDQLPEGNTNLYFLAERAITAAADAYVRYDEPQALTTTQINQFLDNLGILNKIRQPVGNVWRWEPNTPFYAETLVDGQMVPADIVFYQGDLYITNVDFTSGGTFEERRWPEGLVLSRLTKDIDLEYLEITANASAPLTTGQEIGAYIAMRKMTIYEQESLPNARLNGPKQHHVAACNIGITSPLIIDVKRWNGGNNTEEQIGTITFDPNGQSGWIPGVFVFSDPNQPPAPEPTQMFFDVYDTLILRANTVPSGFQWVRVNLLGTCLKFVSPDYDLPS